MNIWPCPACEMQLAYPEGVDDDALENVKRHHLAVAHRLIMWDDPPAPPPTPEQQRRILEWWRSTQPPEDER